MKRRKLLRMELDNPERTLYCLAMVIVGEQLNNGARNASEVFRNMARSMRESDPDMFAASCCSRAGFGLQDKVDVVGKLGHLERLCEAVFEHYDMALPEYQACEGYRPVTAVYRNVSKRGKANIEAVDCDDVEHPAPWMDAVVYKSEWE